MIKSEIYCDRCGKIVEYSRNCRGQRIFRNKYFLKNCDDDWLDMCQSCYDSLAEWIKIGKAESEDKE